MGGGGGGGEYPEKSADYELEKIKPETSSPNILEAAL